MNTRTRNKYDTILIYLFITGNEHLIPAEIRNSIPYSTQATWRGYASEKYIGNTLRYMFDEGIRTANLHNKHKNIKPFLKAMENIYVTMATILDTIKLPLYQVKAHRQTIIDLIQLHGPTVGLDKLIAYFRISKTTYHNWLLDVKVKCSASYFELCT
ncbi:MAG: hypothetical protein H7331_05500, partial [Bacteroidia bacterium]|nr:hypothetical protein [Bacteroidia bacterium]